MKSFWRWTGTIFFALAFIFLVLTGIGTSIPIDHHAACTAYFDGPQGDLFAAIADDATSTRWRPDIANAILVSGNGPSAVWRETDIHGHAITYRTTAYVDNSALARTIEFVPGMPFGGTWTFGFAHVDPSSGNASKILSAVSIREDGQIYNPFFRFLARYVFGYTKNMQTYLQDLGRIKPHDSSISCSPITITVTSAK